ncbi:MAG: hypothetical protein HYV14_02455 [Elusimicrobia bacterium]|nr:hypothetical protein [Elusimicrobiota bacterium]
MACNDDTQRLNAPYLVGALLAVNAVPDSCLLIDGAECSMTKAEFVYGNHDLASTLLDAAGGTAHRLEHSYKDIADLVKDREPDIARVAKELLARPALKVLFLSPRPCCSILAVDYRRIVRGAAKDSAKPVLPLPSDALSGDWLDGYADALEALARAVDLKDAAPDPKKVAIVGYMMDRNEQDHVANIAELRRLLAGLGMELASVWLGNVPYGELSDVKAAGTILSLPYGRKAAKVLADRLGVKAVELELPFGLLPTEDWIRAVAEACKRPKKAAEALIAAELAPVLKRLEWVVPQAMLHKRVALAADPYLFAGLAQLADDLGWEVAATALMSRPDKMPRGLADRFPGLPRPLCQPTSAQWDAALAEAGPVDIIVGNSFFQQGRTGAAAIELGYPSYAYHALSSQPFLGFAGCLRFVERALNATLHRDIGAWGVVMRYPMFEGAGAAFPASPRRSSC